MLVEIAGTNLYFQVLSRTGWTVDSGVIERQTQIGHIGPTVDAGGARVTR